MKATGISVERRVRGVVLAPTTLLAMILRGDSMGAGAYGDATGTRWRLATTKRGGDAMRDAGLRGDVAVGEHWGDTYAGGDLAAGTLPDCWDVCGPLGFRLTRGERWVGETDEGGTAIRGEPALVPVVGGDLTCAGGDG